MRTSTPAALSCLVTLGLLVGCGGSSVPPSGPGSSLPRSSPSPISQEPSGSALPPSSDAPKPGGFAAALAEQGNGNGSGSSLKSQPTTPTPPPTARPNPPPPPPSPTANREWLPGKYMAEAVGLVAGAAQKLQSGSQFGFSVESSSILGAYVRAGQTIKMRQTFSKDYEYVLLGGGSSGAQDVDLAVLDANGMPVAADISADRTPVVKFRPKATGVHEIRLVLTRSQLGGNFVAVASMRSGGYNVPRENIVESFSKVLAGAGRIAQAPAVQQRGGLSFHESGNWSFYATVLKPNEKTSFAGLNLVKSPTIVLAGADSRARNVDLAVEDLTTSQLVGKDDGPDASAIVILNTVVPNHNYRVSVANAGSNGPSLVTMLVLDTGTPAGGGTTTVLSAPQ
ncbi:MAG: hypothetical protein JNM74_16515 [Myxococcales bacterium]|nr:hypothetical protein [Myxococcales bacterium]